MGKFEENENLGEKEGKIGQKGSREKGIFQLRKIGKNKKIGKIGKI